MGAMFLILFVRDFVFISDMRSALSRENGKLFQRIVLGVAIIALIDFQIPVKIFVLIAAEYLNVLIALSVKIGHCGLVFKCAKVINVNGGSLGGRNEYAVARNTPDV